MSYEATVFRAVDFETPLWAFPNLSDGRYNLANTEPATQYLSLHPMTPWAELLRNLNRRTPEQALAMRVPIWAVRLRMAEEPTAIGFANVDAYSSEPEALVADDQSACRALAATLYGLGLRSFFAPSAALPGTANLVVLEPAVVVDFHAEPLSADDWPTAMAAQDGRCPEGLWNHVHYRGAGVPHPAFEAWRNGDEFEFEQPFVDRTTLRAA